MESVISALKKALLEKQSFKIEQLGWFSAQRISAKINTSKHRFTPPAYQIIFSQNEIPVTLNFETFLSETLKITDEEAQSQLAAFSEQVFRSLKETGKYHLEGLGELFLQGKKILFKMDADSEINAEYFGLKEFTLKPKKTSKRWLWILILLILLCGAGAGGYFYKYFDKTPPVQDTPIQVVPQDIESEETYEVEDPETTIITEEFTAERFYLIAGCFKSEENAWKLITQLQNKGFSPKIVGQTPQGLYRVALDEGYATKEEALQMRVQYPDYWVLKH